MAKLLQINSGIFSDNSQSSKLADKITEQWSSKYADGAVIKYDFAVDHVPHLDGHTMQAFMTPDVERSPEQQEAVALSDKFIAELKEADTVVLGVPLYNLSVPSTLKAWFDHICRAGITFSYSETGPVGLLENKKVVIAAARGGVYAGTPYDTQTEWLKHIFGLIGITDLEFIYYEGAAYGEEQAAAALAKAHEEVAKLAF